MYYYATVTHEKITIYNTEGFVYEMNMSIKNLSVFEDNHPLINSQITAGNEIGINIDSFDVEFSETIDKNDKHWRSDLIVTLVTPRDGQEGGRITFVTF